MTKISMRLRKILYRFEGDRKRRYRKREKETEGEKERNK